MAEKNFLEMSDEELLNVDPSTFDKDEGAVDSPEDEEVEVSNQQEEVENVEATDDGSDSEESTGQEADASEEEGLLNEEEASEEVAEDKEESNPEQTKDASDSEADTFDYKAEYQRLTAPFKANGREIAVKSVDDAIALMQMGANYNKKMAALKPNLKLMKLLENNGLLNEEKIGYLIDLTSKNPEAINKLVKDSGLDPLDLNADKASDYKPTHRAVDDREFELDTVLDELQESPAYNRVLDIVTNKWDGSSKQVIANQPQLLKVINSHVESGIYDLISAEIENERTFGRLAGLSDIEAYRQVGDAIQARGGFNQVVPTQGQRQQTPTQPKVVVPPPKMGNEDKLREKRRAASVTKPAVSTKPSKADFDPLAMSDDEFGKLINNQFL